MSMGVALNIGILTASNPELRQQGSNAPADAQTETVATAVIPEPRRRPTGNVAPSANFASLRATLDAQIAGDVATGQLSADGATAVHATLDAIDNRTRPSLSVPALQAARQYLATIPPGTLINRFG